MNIRTEELGREEAASLELCSLYEGAGYSRYRMRKFEEYSLYLENKNFLSSEYVITFNGLDGRLLALKPDVTLSIVKNTQATEETGEKLYYRESVYRLDRKSREYREIGQIGLEMLGGVDAVGEAEVCSLALGSLSALSDRSVLAVSHMGFLDAVLASLGVSGEGEERLLGCLRTRNRHELAELCASLGVPGERAEAFSTLIDLGATREEMLVAARRLAVTEAARAAVGELESLFSVLADAGHADRLRLDFSIVSDRGYYNGIVFSGYIDGVPKAVLAGGRYDRLAGKFGRKISAMGFAVYLSELAYFFHTPREFDADCLLLYGENDAPEAVCRRAKAIRETGKTVRVEKRVPAGLRFREIRRVEEKTEC